MKPAPVPTLFAQILGLVVVSLITIAVVGVGAILLFPQTDERFTVGEVQKAVQTRQAVKSESNNRWLSVTYETAPPPKADGPAGDFRFAIARVLDVDSDNVVYWSPQRSPLWDRLLERVTGEGRRPAQAQNQAGRQGEGPPPATPPAGRGPTAGAPNEQAGRAPGDARGGGPGAPGPGGQGGQGGGFGRGGFSSSVINRLEPLLTTPEQRAIVEEFREDMRLRQQQSQEGTLGFRVAQIFKVAVKQPDGRWMVVQPQRTLNLYSWQITMLGVLLISILLVSPLAWLLARRVSQPLVAFAAAAERLGRDPRSPPLEASGSSEVRMAVNAFNEMQVRLRRYVEDRTAMVAAIAHDLRTPLTRVRFRVDALSDDVRPKLEADIDEMDEMISSALAFARDAALPAERSKLDLSALIETIFDDAEETGADVKLEPVKDRLVVMGDSLSLKRMLTNLVDNAVKYGKHAQGRIYRQDDKAVIEIDDKGPGIPQEELERVFEPFYRRESSRNRSTGGSGLGLAVVRSIALAHGGMVTLENKQGGGLRAKIVLPL